MHSSIVKSVPNLVPGDDECLGRTHTFDGLSIKDTKPMIPAVEGNLLLVSFFTFLAKLFSEYQRTSCRWSS